MVVGIKAYGDSVFFGRFYSFKANLFEIIAERRSNADNIKPIDVASDIHSVYTHGSHKLSFVMVAAKPHFTDIIIKRIIPKYISCDSAVLSK